MKPDKILPVFLSAALSALISVACLGCLITGFSLEPENLTLVFSLCTGAAVLFSCLFSWKRGALPAACLVAMGLGYLWHRGTAWQQALNLLVKISKFYHGAYDWG